MLTFINTLATAVIKRRVKRLEKMMLFPAKAQEKTFENLLQTLVRTKFGQEHGITLQDNLETFRKKIPVRKYEDFYPYIERTLKGEAGVLWQGKTKWFAKSSGTTNDKSKFIPVSSDSLYENHYKAGKDMVAVYIHNRPDTKIFTGKSLSIGGSHEISKFNRFARYGDLSAVLIENMPWFYELFRAPSKEVALMSEWESKIQKMAEETIEENITAIAGVPTWTLVLIEKLFEIFPEKADNLLNIWPHLEVFWHGAVSFTPYRETFKKLCPSEQMKYMEIYNASEGYFAFEHEFGRQDMMLLLEHGIFYEFLPMENLNEENPETLLIDEVEAGKNYALVISTLGGLWRYLIGDTVSFTNTQPATIVITGRTKHFLNAFGEEVMVGNAEKAIAFASQETRASVEDFTATAQYLEEGGVGRHEWIIEFSVTPKNPEHFAFLLDKKLQEINSDYEAKRYKNMALKPPLLHFVPKGTFYKWMKQRGKLGGQNKVPRLSNERKYVEEILEMLCTENIPFLSVEVPEIT